MNWIDVSVYIHAVMNPLLILITMHIIHRNELYTRRIIYSAYMSSLYAWVVTWLLYREVIVADAHLSFLASHQHRIWVEWSRDHYQWKWLTPSTTEAGYAGRVGSRFNSKPTHISLIRYRPSLVDIICLTIA